MPPVDPGGGGGSFMDNVTTATYRHYPSILELLTKLLIRKTTSADSRSVPSGTKFRAAGVLKAAASAFDVE